jgi:hypothetical protein
VVPIPGASEKESTFECRARPFDSVDRVNSNRQNGVTFNDPKDKYIYRFPAESRSRWRPGTIWARVRLPRSTGYPRFGDLRPATSPRASQRRKCWS